MHKYLRLLLLMLPVLWGACRDDKVSHSPGRKLEFSADTVFFDTLFATRGSATARLMVYNRSHDNLRISRISLGGGEGSPFRVNLDGLAGRTFEQIFIPDRDSLFVFVEVTIDPTDADTPFVVEDSIVFLTNGNEQKVYLGAYGQNAIRLTDHRTTQDTVLHPELPYLIEGTWEVLPEATMTLTEGCRFFCHHGAAINVRGRLHAEGTVENPVVFRPDRLDYFLADYPYDALSGQWEGIRLFGTAGGTLRNVVMRGGVTALSLHADEEGHAPTLDLRDVTLHNFDSCGIRAVRADVTMTNALISNCRTGALMQSGGALRVAHSTLAGYYVNLASALSRSGATVRLADHVGDEPTPFTALSFVNSIIYGSQNVELTLDFEDETASYRFDACLLRYPEVEDDSRFTRILWNVSPEFRATRYPYDFTLTAESPARDPEAFDAEASNACPADRYGRSRLADGVPDLGAVEYDPTLDAPED